MRTSTASFGLAAPLLLTFAFLAMAIPHAVAQTPTYTVSGIVLGDTGEALSGANVDGYSYPASETDAKRSADSPTRGASTVTDAAGRFKLSLPAGKAYVSVSYSSWRSSDSREFELANDTELTFTLKSPPPKTAVVEGRVLDIQGNPVEGAEVRLDSVCCYYYDEIVSVRSDETQPPAEETTTQTSVATPEPATAESGGSSGSATGVASPAIMPPDRCCCCPYDESLTYTTKADGVYRFTTYGGPRQLVASAKGFAQTTQSVELVDNQTVTADVVLEKVPARDASVRGRVTDAQTGAPLGNAQVNIRSLEWSRWGYNATGKDGGFQFLTVPGWAEITVSYYAYPEPIPLAVDDVASSIVKPPETQYYAYSRLVKLVSGENTIDVQLERRPTPDIALIGYVVDPDTKQAVAGATINVWNQDVGDWGSATTDATGSFRILVRPGHFQANAWKDGYLGGSHTFEVTEEPTQRVDVLLPKGTQKWAPCYDDYDCGGGPVYYREAMSSDGGSGVAKGVAVPAMAPAPSGSEGDTIAEDSTATLATNQRTAGFSDETGKSAAYSGSGGNLPPYDPEAAGSVPAAQNVPSEVPGFGVALLAGAAVAVALLSRRK